MTPLEQQVWAAAFANQFATDLAYNHASGRTIDDIDGYSCAEIANVAVDKLRAAFEADPEAENLMPGWELR